MGLAIARIACFARGVTGHSTGPRSLLLLSRVYFHHPLLLFRGVLGVQESQSQAHGPGRAAFWMQGVGEEFHFPIDGLTPEFLDSSRTAAEGHGPDAAARGVPVGGNDRC